MKNLSLIFVFLLSGIPGIQSKSEDRNPLKSQVTPNKEIVRDVVKISKENHIHKMSINNKPCAVIRDGTRIIFECWDALEGKSKEYYEYLNAPAGTVKEVFVESNPATGPVYVEGALPGNVLEIEINDITLSRIGYMQLNKNQFIDNSERQNVYVEIEVTGNQMLYNSLRMPIQPMVGVIGTAGLKEIACQEAGDNGSNMDTRIIRKGSKVLLPVFVEGGLLAVGDVHAVMGDGEVFGQGIEIGSEIDLTVRIIKDLTLQRPMIINPDRIACVASDPDILTAKSKVVQDMGKYLVNVCGYNSLDAAALIAFYGNLHFSQVVNPQKTIRMEIETKYMNYFEHK